MEGDILIDFLDGVEPARSLLERLADEGVIRVSALSAAEVVARATPGNVEPALRLLDSFGIVPVDREVARRAGLFLTGGRGDKLELGTCIVAACCAELGAALVTKDAGRYPSEGFEVLQAGY